MLGCLVHETSRDLDTETETRRLWDSRLILRLRPGISKTRDRDWDWDWKIWFFETETETETQKIGLTRLRLSWDREVSWDLIDTESLADLCFIGKNWIALGLMDGIGCVLDIVKIWKTGSKTEPITASPSIFASSKISKKIKKNYKNFFRQKIPLKS